MENQHLTFDQLPQRIHEHGLILEELKQLVLRLSNSQPNAEELDIPNMDVQQAADFLKLKVPTVYSKVSKGELPTMKRGNRLYFSKKDLIAYLKQGRNLTITEIEAQAADYLENSKKKLKPGLKSS